MKYREADLYYIYIRVGTQNKTLAEMTDKEFADWILSKIEQYQLDSFKFNPQDSFPLDKRIEVINRLDKKGVIIYMIKRERRDEWNKG